MSPVMGVKFQEYLVIRELTVEEFLRIYKGLHRSIPVLDTVLFFFFFFGFVLLNSVSWLLH